MTTDKLRQITRQVVAMLVAKEYGALERITHARRLSSKALMLAVKEYGRNLVTPPDEAFIKLDCMPVRDTNPSEYGLRFDLWTAEEGRSDLTLEFTIRGRGDAYEIEIDDLHVL